MAYGGMNTAWRGTWLAMLGMLVTIAACGGGGGTPPGTCTTSVDCAAGEECVGGECRAVDGGGDGPVSPSDATEDGPPADDDAATTEEDGETATPGDDGDGGTEGDRVESPDADAPTEADAETDDGGATDGPPPCVPIDEICNTGRDEDCDGFTDEEDCLCRRGTVEPCYDGPWGTAGRGPCRGGARICIATGVWSDCRGQVVPAELPEASCDGIDNDCDGVIDGGVTNACGECTPLPAELCGNSLDDDCDGVVDEGCACDPLCLLPDPADCHPPVDQPCYEGPPSTLGFGPCAGGLHDCTYGAGGWVWTPCAGQVLPATECAAGIADGVDNDCDGATDEDCVVDADGDTVARPFDCNDEDPAVRPGATETCDAIDNDCDGVADEDVTNGCGGCWVPDPDESCGNGYDDDCNGLVDDGCSCIPGDETWCYGGPPGTEDHPPCRSGEHVCDSSGKDWGPCAGEVLPGPEICDGIDNDCDGTIDERGAVGANPCGYCVDVPETCDGIDNDCDGLTDERLRNACGECLPVPPESLCDGIDNDCDGLTDEGLVNACGLCPPAPCFEEPYPDPGDCSEPGRSCTGTEPWPDDPTAVTLGQGTVRSPYIYVALDGRNQVAKLDTETGAKVWQVSSWGTSPSRTAVALDHTVWVGNRGFANPRDPNHSNLVHLDADGNLICRADVTGLARGVAIDGDGNVWGGTWDGRSVWKIHGSDVDRSVTPPRCRILTPGGINVGVPIYGLAVDGSGYLWSCSPGCPESAVCSIRLDTRTHTFTRVPINACYGIAVSPADGRIWFGSYWGGGCVNSVSGTAPHTRFNTSVGCGGVITAVTVDIDGFIWASSYALNRVYKIDPVTGTQLCSAPISAPGARDARGVAMDGAGKIWVVHRVGGYANRYLRADCSLDPAGNTFPIDPGYTSYTYSDMTGMQLRTVTTREGHWIQNFDSGYAGPTWHAVTWTADVPADTTVEVTVTAADSEAELVTAPTPPCGPFTASPADLLACPWLSGHRWLSVDVRLTTVRDGVRPVVRDVRVLWSY